MHFAFKLRLEGLSLTGGHSVPLLVTLSMAGFPGGAGPLQWMYKFILMWMSRDRMVDYVLLWRWSGYGQGKWGEVCGRCGVGIRVGFFIQRLHCVTEQRMCANPAAFGYV